MMYEVKQFIFNSGEEVICEVLEWAEKNHTDILVKNAMCIALISGVKESYYSFKPWIHYVESPTDCIVVNSDHIVATATPNHLLLFQYQQAVLDMHDTYRQRDMEYRKKAREKLKQSAIAIQEAILEKQQPSIDSDRPSNIIRFPD